jgi:hypothetical protein
MGRQGPRYEEREGRSMVINTNCDSKGRNYRGVWMRRVYRNVWL